MLADQLAYIVAVDPDRDSRALAVVQVPSGAVIVESTVIANSDGYAQALRLVDRHAPGRRAFPVEGAGSFGAGLTRFLTGRGERVLEVGRLRRERRSGGKTDALDAARMHIQPNPRTLTITGASRNCGSTAAPTATKTRANLRARRRALHTV